MTSQWGMAWDIWPRQTGLPRIAIGHSGTMELAQKAVEKMLAADDSALYGTVDVPFEARWFCKRKREPGEFDWSQMPMITPLSSAQ